MPNKMSSTAASRIQSSQAKTGGDMSSKGFAARAQSAAAKGNPTATGHGTPSGGQSGGTSSSSSRNGGVSSGAKGGEAVGGAKTNKG